MKNNDLFLYHHWTRGNKYIYSSVNDFNYYGKNKSTETGLKYVVNGEESYRFYNKTHVVKKGSCLIVNEDQIFDIHVKKTDLPAEGLCLSIDTILLNDVYNGFLFSNEKLLDNGLTNFHNTFNFCEAIYNADDILCRYLDGMMSHLNKQSGAIFLPIEEMYYGLTRSLLLSQSLIKKQALSIKAARYTTRMELFKRVMKAKQRLDDEPESGISMAELAAEVALSEFHFFRIFKQALGLSPNQYRLRLRMEKAKRLLAFTDDSIDEMAHRLGFADIHSFCKTFKRFFSLSPGRYREIVS